MTTTSTTPTTTTPAAGTNMYLMGPFAPVRDEVTGTDLAVTGEIPEALDGGSRGEQRQRQVVLDRAGPEEGRRDVEHLVRIGTEPSLHPRRWSSGQSAGGERVCSGGGP